MVIGWLTCIPAVLLPHSLCRSTTGNAPANRQIPIASVVSQNNETANSFIVNSEVYLYLNLKKIGLKTIKSIFLQ